MNYPCSIKTCSKEAVGCYRPDIDVKGLCFCEEHRDTVQFAYFLLLQGDEEKCREILEANVKGK